MACGLLTVMTVATSAWGGTLQDNFEDFEGKIRGVMQ